MEFSHSEMMLLIQGLRLINGLDQLGKEFSPTPEDQMSASELLLKIDADPDPVTNPNETLDRSLYGAHESNGLVNGNDYHAQVEQSRFSLKEVADAGGKITRLRVLTERTFGGTFCDISYVHATLPDGKIVTVDCPVSNLTPRVKLTGELIAWAKAQGVFAKGIGLLDKGNWSILD